jgi:hypothetical protein
MKCEAMSRSGRQCQAAALRGKKKCSLHADGERAKKLGAQGGSAKRGGLTVQDVMELCAPENATDCRKLLGVSIAEVRTGRMSTGMAHAIASLAGVFLKASDQSDLEERVRRLEDFAERKNERRPN